MNAAPSPLLTTLLRDVSRSFYTTLRALPGPIRPSIGLAYLLARASDTIADTHLVPVGERLAALNQLRVAILSEAGARGSPAWSSLAAAQTAPAGQGSTAERILLERLQDALALLDAQSSLDRRRIQVVLFKITTGQLLDLKRFGEATEARIVALATDAELEDYTYRVAGCVGEFWTRMCRLHLFPGATLDYGRLMADGIRFGKGLQLVNVLRDLPRDLRQGRCYLPSDDLAKLGLTPTDLLDPANEARVRPLYDAWLNRAQSHLEAGWHYVNTLPFAGIRIRLATAWPALLGVRTLARLRTESFLDPERRIKVSRAEVRSVILRSILFYPLPPLWQRLFTRAGR